MSSFAQRVQLVELVRLHGIVVDEFMIFMFKVARALRIPFTCSRNERHHISPPAETHPYSHPSTCTRTRASPWAGRSSTGYSRIQRTGTPSARTCPPNAGCTRRKGGMIVPHMTCPPTAAIPYPATRSQYWPTGTVGSSSCRSRNL